MQIMESLHAYSQKPKAEQDADFSKLLKAMKADQDRHDAKYGKPTRVFKDRYVNSNFGMGL